MPKKLSTFDERKDRVEELLHDDILDLSPREGFELIYHWMMFELTLHRAKKMHQKWLKHKKWLDDNERVLKLRRELHDL